MLKFKFSTGFFESMLSRWQHSLVSMEFCHFIFHFLEFVDFGSVPILAWVSYFGCVNSDCQQSNSFKTDATHPRIRPDSIEFIFKNTVFEKKIVIFLKFCWNFFFEKKIPISTNYPQPAENQGQSQKTRKKSQKLIFPLPRTQTYLIRS